MAKIRIGASPNQLKLKRAILEMTARCNLSCVHCSREAGASRQDELTTREWLGIVDQLHDYGVDMIVLGGGEPLLELDRVKAIAADAAARGKLTRITTNGLLVDSEQAAFFADNGTALSYAMDGYDAASYQAFRGKNAAYKTLRRSIDVALEYGILDTLAVTATKINLEEVPRVVDFCAEIGVTCVVSKYVPTGRQNWSKLLLDSSQRKAMLDMVAEKRRQHPHIQIATTREPLEGPELGTGSMGILGCIAGVSWCLVSASGEVQPCPYLPLVVGNVRTTPFSRIWESSPHLKKLRDRDAYKGACGTCSVREQCGGCRALAYALTHDYLAGDPQCWRRREVGSVGAA